MTRAAHSDRRLLLKDLVGESRRRPVPEPDWVRMQAALERRIDRLDRDRASGAPASEPTGWQLGQGWRWPTLAVSLVLLALVATGLVSRGGLLSDAPRDQAKIERAPAAQPWGVRDGAALRTGEVVEAADRAVSVIHDQRARWTVEPRGRVRWLVGGPLLTAGLERGAVSVEVIPGSRPESFAVEIGQTRIAAHGTKFRVERTSLGATVTVAEGTVVIGLSRDRGHTQGQLLKAPGIADVNLRGQLTGKAALATGTTSGPRKAPVRGAPSPSPVEDHGSTASEVDLDSGVIESSELVGPASSEQSEVAPHDGVLPEKPDPARIHSEMQVAQHKVRDCFARHTNPAGGVLVTARTQLTVQIGPTGEVTNLDLRPPLAPPVQRCAVHALRSLRFGESQRGGSESRILLLGR